MAEQVQNPEMIEGEEEFLDDSLGARFMDWVRTELIWYSGSFVFHLLGLSMLLVFGSLAPSLNESGEAPSFEEAKQEEAVKDDVNKFEKFDIGDPEDKPPAELDVDPTLEKPGHEAQTEDYIDDNPVYQPKGGGMATGQKDIVGSGGGVLAFGTGPKVGGTQGIGVGIGTGKNWGSGGDGTGFGGRGQGHRKAMLAAFGGTKHTERAVTAALVWLANHQLSDGSWSLQNYTQRCHDKTCTGQGESVADAGATAMGLLPFFAAGQTHKGTGKFKGNIGAGIRWLLAHQQTDGNLAKGCVQPMYSHGLATIALCEAYGLTGDHQVGMAAQGAVNYIEKAQNKSDGGWRYNPGEAGDTSVVGWQLMALKSAHMAGLSVGGSTFANTSKWLDSVATAEGANYAYQPGNGPTNTMSSVGLLCRQYLGAKRDTPMMQNGTKYLMKFAPDPASGGQGSNIYFWYYATQVLHNMSGYEWDEWNRKMRKLLVDTQNRSTDACANGSWDPAGDQWGKRGGRVMTTSLSALTLEIYYRYLPLFKADAAGGADLAAPVPKKEIGEAEAKNEPKLDNPPKAEKEDGAKDDAPAKEDKKVEKPAKAAGNKAKAAKK